jgi:uncharacterized protein YjbI with pentapeptide repeats
MAGPDTNTNAPPTPIWGFGPPWAEPDTKNLDALLASLNGSAERFQTLWFSFLGLTLYLAIAALATTHRNLLLGEPQVLPILNIKVELLPFYVIAPLLYLVFHFYLLMMLALLARTAAEFDKQLRTTLPGEPERERYRAQVGNALFLQLLVGMKGERTGVNALLMGLIALITIVLAPLATLVLMQMMFLPYHHLRITWWHRGIIVGDLVLILVMTYRCFFPRGVRKAPLVLGTLSRKPRWGMAMAFCVLLGICLFPLAYWLSFHEGRWAGEPSPSSVAELGQWMEGERPPFPDANPDYAAPEKGVVFRLFPDRLRINDKPIVGEAKLEETKKEIASRGGDFVATIKLDGRDLQAADLREADLRGVSLKGAALRGANLLSARLDGSRLVAGQLQGADLTRAQLQGADLGSAQLQGTRLLDAHLQGADLMFAQLQDADLTQALLEGANLEYAKFQGADLSYAELPGADLRGARLQGADLTQAQLEGADLSDAELQGADLRAAQLQGADLTRANLSDSDLDGAFVFGADVNETTLSTAMIRGIHTDKVKPGFANKTESLTEADVDTWIAAATASTGEKEEAQITQRLTRLKPVQPTGQDASNQAKWVDLARQSLALDPDGAPYVGRGLVGRVYPPIPGRLAALGDQLERVRTRVRAGRERPDTCKGVAGFTEGDWRRLDAIKPY